MVRLRRGSIEVQMVASKKVVSRGVHRMGSFRENKTFHTLILLVDVVIVLLSYYAAFYIRFSIGDIPMRNMNAYVNLLPYMTLIAVFVLLVYDLYTVPRKMTSETFSSVFVAVLVIAGLIGLASFLFRQLAFPRSIILIGSIIAIATLLLWLSFISIFAQRKKKRVLIIGTEKEIGHIMDKVKNNYPAGTHFKTMAPTSDVSKLIHGVNAVDVVLLCDSLDKRVREQIIHHSVNTHAHVFVVPDTYDLMLTGAEATAFDDLLVLSVNDLKLEPEQHLVKRLCDLVFSLTLIVVTLPVMLLTALALKISEPQAPVIYKQRRMTMNDKEFNIYKFRTMIPDAESDTGPVLAAKDDARITKIGKFLRATRIDELPQLFNVLKGDMSVVGPRPERPHFTKIYKKQYGTYRYRSAVKAGLTGLAQVAGKYETDVEDKLRYDLYYIRNYSVLFDIIIIFRTIRVILDKQKASGISLKKVPLKKEKDVRA